MTHSADSSAIVRLFRFVERRQLFLLTWNLNMCYKNVALDQKSSLFLVNPLTLSFLDSDLGVSGVGGGGSCSTVIRQS